MAARVVDEAARALGTLVSQIANFAMPQKILLAGEGWACSTWPGRRWRKPSSPTAIPGPTPVNLETKVSDFHDWARGAAVLAIQVLVLGSGET